MGKYPSLLKELDNFLSQKRSYKRKAHYPSQVSIKLPEGRVIGKCLRAQYYAWRGTKPSNPIEAGNLWKMKTGNAIHTLIAKWIKKIGYQVKEEYAFKCSLNQLTYPISGRIDDIIVFPKINKFFGVEVKTGYSRYFTSKTGIKKAGPRIEDLMQIAVYLYCVEGLEAFYLIYFARDNAYRTEFVITKENIPINFWDIVKRWQELEKCLQDSTLPPRDYWIEYPQEVVEKLYTDYLKKTKAKKPLSLKAWRSAHKGDWQCSYCQFKDICKKGG